MCDQREPDQAPPCPCQRQRRGACGPGGDRADGRLPQHQRPYRQPKPRTRPADLPPPHRRPRTGPQRQTHHDVPQPCRQPKLPHRTDDRVVVGYPAVEAAPVTDALQRVVRQQGDAAGGHGDAQTVGGQQEARLMSIDVGTLDFRREVLRCFRRLQGQDQSDLVRQRRRRAAELVRFHQDAGVA